jgi:3'-phosphoadenosine 5'-phosphosulfate sulfotransferase (PAPS reductase)/FAD synthetase
MSQITPPLKIEQLLQDGAILLVSVSGGKDSDCMALELTRLRAVYGWSGDLLLIHSDTGMEHPESEPHCRELARQIDVELVVVRHQYTLLEGIRRRMAKRPDAPPFPSSQARYCTATWKRDLVSKFIRNTYPSEANVVCAIGIRSSESRSRARRKTVTIRKGAAAPTKNRQVLDWLPIHHYTLSDVWNVLGYSLPELLALQKRYAASDPKIQYQMEQAFKAHVAYLRGNNRVSCALCSLANKNDLANGARYNPDLFRELVEIEITSGFSFQHKRWLADFAPELLTADQRQRLAQVRAQKHQPQQLSLF